MADVLDTFTRPDSSTLGTSDSGHVWTRLRGATALRAGRAYPAAPNALEVVEAGAGGQDAALTLQIGAGGGQALYFRVVDVGNWWRASVRYYSYTYQSGTTQVFSHYETRTVGYTPTEYEYRQDYGGFVDGFGHPHHGSTSQNHGNITPLYKWSTDPNLTEISYETYSHSHTHTAVSGSSFAAHYVPNIGPAYKTGNVRGGDPITQQVAVYTTQPTYATGYAYDVRLDKAVAGVVSPVLTKTVGATALTSLRVTAQGSTIALFSSASPTTAHGVTTDTTHATATKHGIGYAETSELSNTTGVDSFTVAPYNTPPAAPTLLAPVGNESVALNQTQRFRLAPNDPDQGDAVSRTDWEFRLVAGTAVTSVTQATAQTYLDRPAGTFTAGAWQWRARTWDRAGAVSEWSAWAFYTATNPPAAPTITSPTNNAPLTASIGGLVTWAADNQDAYELAVYGETDGAVDTSKVYRAPAVVVSTDRSATIPRPVNTRTEYTVLRVRYLGLWSDPATVKNQVQWASPVVARLRLAVDARRGYILTSISYPPAGAGQPVVSHARLWRRVVGSDRPRLVGDDLAIGTFTDAQVGHRVDYEYQVEAVSVSGTTSLTEWTGLLLAGEVGEGAYADANYSPAAYA